MKKTIEEKPPYNTNGNDCLLQHRCKTASRIDCTDRDYTKCDFYLNLLRECKPILTKKELKHGVIVKHCCKCKMPRRHKPVDHPKFRYRCMVCGEQSWKRGIT